jgi:hypothetical protein
VSAMSDATSSLMVTITLGVDANILTFSLKLVTIVLTIGANILLLDNVKRYIKIELNIWATQHHEPTHKLSPNLWAGGGYFWVRVYCLYFSYFLTEVCKL